MSQRREREREREQVNPKSKNYLAYIAIDCYITDEVLPGYTCTQVHVEAAERQEAITAILQ